MQQNELFVGYNGQQQNQLMQQQYVPNMRPIQPTTSAYYNQSFIPTTMTTGGGKLT